MVEMLLGRILSRARGGMLLLLDAPVDADAEKVGLCRTSLALAGILADTLTGSHFWHGVKLLVLQMQSLMLCICNHFSLSALCWCCADLGRAVRQAQAAVGDTSFVYCCRLTASLI